MIGLNQSTAQVLGCVYEYKVKLPTWKFLKEQQSRLGGEITGQAPNFLLCVSIGHVLLT